MGTAQQVYCAVSGDYSGGPNANDRGDTAGVTRGALDYFFGLATAGQKKAVIGLGDLNGADSNSAGYLRSYDVWGGGDETPGEVYTCQGQAPAVSVRGALGRCYDHSGTGPHTGYMNAAIRNVTLPIPGNHDRDSQDCPGPYDGYWSFWREHNNELPGQLRPTNLGFPGSTSGTAYEAGPFRYTADLPAADGNSYWRVGLIDVDPWLNGGDSSQRAGLVSWITTELAAAAALGRHMIWGWHEPAWQIGGNTYGANDAFANDVLDLLQAYSAGFMVIFGGHIHGYARWNPMLYNGDSIEGSASHGQAAITQAAYESGAPGLLHIQSGLGGQNPMWVPLPGSHATYWTNVATQSPVVCRPLAAANDGKNKATVSWFQGASAQEQPRVGSGGDPAAQTELDRTGQPGFPYGVTGMVLDADRFSFKFYGNRAPYTGYPAPQNIVEYDASPTFIWSGAGGGGGGGGGGGTGFGWRSAELYGGGGTQGISFDPNGTRVIVGGDNNGVKVSFDGGINWLAALGGYPDTADALQTVAVLWSRDASTPDRTWTGNKNGLFVSNNAGRDWKRITQWPGNFTHNGPTNDRPRVNGKCIDDDGAGNLYMVDSNGAVFRYRAWDADGLNGSFVRIASLAETGTGLCLDPTDPTVLYVATREGGLYQLQGIRTTTAGGATVRVFTGTGALAQAEEVVAVNEGTATTPDVRLYVAGAGATAAAGAVKRVTRGNPAGSAAITNAWTDITPPLGSGWCAVDAVRSAGSTLLAVGCAVNPKTSNGCVEVYYAANGHAASPTWRLLTGDDADSDFVNQMGGPGGKPWWGYGLRAGAQTGEKSPNRWINGNGGVEGVAFDPGNPNRIIGVGQNMAFIFDTAAKKAYPSVVGLMSGVETMPIFDPLDDDHIMITNNDHIQHTTKTGGYGGDWRKNQTGCSPGGESAMFLAAFVGGHQYAGFGERFQNLYGKVYFHLDATNGDPWTDLNLPTGGKRPMGLAGRRIGGNDVIVVGVQNSGIWKRVFTSPGAGGSWALQDTGPFAAMGAGKRQRPFPLYFASDTVLYCYDPTTGIWRSTNAGAAWTKIWGVVCDAEREGYIAVPPDDPTTLYASFGKSAPTAAEGVWRLDGADTGTVEAGTITTVRLKRPNGTAFVDPGTIACASGGRLGVTEFGTTPDPSAYLSRDGGATFADITDDYFRRAARKVFGSGMGENGRWIVTANGPGAFVYDDATSAGGDGTGGGDPGGGGGTGTITRTTLLQWAVTDPSGTTFVTDALTTPVGGADRLIVVDVFNSDSANAEPPSDLSGLGLTWTQRQTRVLVGSDLTERQVTTYTAVSTGPVTGALTVTFPTAQNGCAVAVTEYANVDVGSGGAPMTVSVIKPVTPVADTAANNAGPYTTPSWTPGAGHVLLVVVQGVSTTGTPPTVSNISGTGLSFGGGPAITAVSTDGYGTYAFWATVGGSPGATTISVTFAAAVQGAVIEVLEFANADPTTPIAQWASRAAAASSTPTLSLANPPAATSMVVAVDGIRRNPAGWTDEAGWTLQGDVDTSTGSPPNGVHVATKVGDQTWGGTGTNGTNWGLIIEIQGAPGGIGDPVAQSAAADWGSTASKPTISLPNPLASPASAVHVASVTVRNPAAWDPEVGWDEVWDSGYASPLTGTYVASDLAGNDGTFAAAGGTNGRWSATALEIKAAAGGGVIGGVEVEYDVDYIAGALHELEYDVDYLATTVAINTLTSGASDADAGAYVTASVTPTAGRSVYAAVESAMSDGTAPPIPTASGAGLSWSRLATTVYDAGTTTQRRRLTVFRGTGTPSAGGITFGFGAALAPDGAYEAAVVKGAAGFVGTAASWTNPTTNWATLGVDVVASSAFSSGATNSFTAEAVVKLSSTGGNRRVFQMGDSGSGFQAAIYYGSSQIHALVKIATVNRDVAWTDAGLLSNGSFHHVAVRYDDATDELSIWVDGVKRNQGTFAGTLNIDGTKPLRIGNVPSSASSGDAWDGIIDEFAWYPAALSDARLMTHAAAASGAYAAEVLADAPVAYYHLDETSGTVAANAASSSPQTHANWFVIESNGTPAQVLVGTTQAGTQVDLAVTPSRAATTVLAFAAKKGASVPSSIGGGSATIGTLTNAAPSGAALANVTALPDPATITVGTPDVADIGMIALELVTAESFEREYGVDYLAAGTAVVTPGKKRPHRPRRFLSRVFATIAGAELPLADDWEFSETAFGGFDRATLGVPARYARRHPRLVDQDAVVTFWNDAGAVLWEGRVQRPPEFRDGYARLECAGEQARAREINDRLLYQVAGTAGWASADADPHGLSVSNKYDASIEPGRLMITRQKGETYQSGQKSGWVFWADGADLDRVAFVIRKSASMSNFEIRLYRDNGPQVDLGQLVETWGLGDANPDGTPKVRGNIAGAQDLLALLVYCNTDGVTPGSNEKIWLQDIRVNAIADNDTYTTAEVARDIARRLGWDVSGSTSSDFNALPYDVNGDDWGTALDYMSQLDDRPWGVYEDRGSGPYFRRRAWEDDPLYGSFETGLVADLTPEPIYDLATVVWRGPSGKEHRATASQPGGGRELPPVEMSDVQRNGDNAEAYAERLLREYGVERYTGTITLGHGRREVRAGREIVIRDWAPGAARAFRTSDVSQKADGITFGVRTPQIVSRWLARYALRQRRRARAA